jgi:hypothetical protein
MANDWRIHLTSTFNKMRMSNPATKLGDAMKAASKTFKKLNPLKMNKTKHYKKHGKKSHRNKHHSRKRGKRGGEPQNQSQNQN